MKDLIQSQLRHLFTGFSGVVVALITFLVSKGYLTAEQATEFTPLLAELFKNAGAVISSLLAVVLSRILITLLGNTRFGQAVLKRFGLVILCGFTAVGLGFSLPSCSPAQQAAVKKVIGGLDVRFTPDGCMLIGKTTAKGNKYYGGVCVDGRIVARWDQRQLDGSFKEIRYTRFPDGNDALDYRDGKSWLTLDEKSGVQSGEIPVASIEQLALPQRGGNHGPPIVSREAGIVPQK